ncbi:aminodeoxychorismate lyase [Enterovibrio nigricans]|uniref:Aminodeoxychorismate lyase n=1 Tax=Enterovibrio nigricans DSM 22720 TaxID=1121868 RepID=A0A1T4V751_9GAMM|nr:aminodeoxychorismate lyase [Enterovibrio nigricans]PKF50336.1 aminodeoxychorismate lyase [Enterovibrio nigricans]SKA60682.1 4-amino-4-deoxychorismate lyase [Enterovibrio nigricans DSM 22720]
MILLNGSPETRIDIADRGFQYGDGCYTTMLARHGKILALPLHIARLMSNTQALAINVSNWQEIESWVNDVALSTESDNNAVIKVLVSRGVGGRGYSPSGCSSPTIVVSSHAFPPAYSLWKEKGINTLILDTQLGLSPLAGIKHLNRLEQVLIKKEVEERGADDGLVCDLNGNLVEASASNIFWRKGRTLYTPDLTLSGVEGTMRRQIIESAPDCGYQVEIAIEKPDVLWDADEVFITNAVMGIVPIRCIERTNYNDFDACRALTLRLNA